MMVKSVSESNNADIFRLTKLLEKKKSELIFFVGAAVSAAEPSCLPLWNEFVCLIAQALCNRSPFLSQYYDKISRSKIRPEVFLQSIHTEINEQALEVFNILDIHQPNPNHFFLAKLLKEGYVKKIITPNFDRLIEYSLNQEESNANQFLVAAKVSDLGKKPGEIRILKIHGTVEDSSSIIATLDQAGMKLAPAMANELISLFRKFVVVVIGYSGEDLDIYRTLYQSGKEAREVIWNFKKGSKRSERLKRLMGRYGNRVRVMETNIEQLFPELAAKLNIELPDYDTHVRRKRREEQQQKLGKWASKIEKDHLYIIIGDVLENIGDLKGATGCYNKTLELARRKNNVSGIAAAHIYIGLIYYRQEKYGRAIQHFNKALAANLKINDLGQVGKSLGNLGLVWMQKEEWKKAIRSFEKGLNYFKKVNDRRNIGKVFTDLGIAYSRMGKYETALQCHRKSFKFKQDVQGLASSHMSIGGTYLFQGKKSLAIRHLRQSLDLFQRVGDVQLECLAHNALATAYKMKDQPEVALKHWKKARGFAEKLADEDKTLSLINANLKSLYNNMRKK